MPLNTFINSEGQITTQRDWYVDRSSDIRQEVWRVEATYKNDHSNKNVVSFHGPQAKDFSQIWESILKVTLP